MIIGERMRAALEQANQSQSGLARRVGISQASIAKLVSGNAYGSKHLHKIARELGTTAEYLTGETNDPLAGAHPLPTADIIAEQIDAVMVPMIDLSFSMGAGLVIDEGSIIGEYPFSREWLRARISGRLEDVMLITGEGDSMSPTIMSGDVLLVDRAQRTVRQQDQIWAIAMHEVGMIKRLRKQRDGYAILSDNPAVPVDHADDGEMQIVGRVISIQRWQ